MKRLLAFILSLSILSPSWGALANTVQWEVETGGVDTNGGGFDSAGSGTDYSLQSAAQYSVTDLVTSGTTSVVSASAAFGATDMPGNVCYITGGTGSITAARYSVVSRTNSTTIVLDRSTGLSAGTGATLKCGGALLTVQKGLDQLTADQILWIKSGTYSISAVLTMPSITAINYFTRIYGYGTTHGDTGRATISQTAAANGLNQDKSGVYISNLIFDGTSTGLLGINDTGPYGTLSNLTIKNWTAGGVSLASNVSIYDSDISSGTGVFNSVVIGNNSMAYCYVHDNSYGPSLSAGGRVIGSVFANNTNSGLTIAYDNTVIGSLFYGNGSHGIDMAYIYSPSIGSIIRNNIFAKNGGYGINSISSFPSSSKVQSINGNAFWSNTSGTMLGISNYGDDVNISGSDPTNDPFVDKANKNWALNNTAGAGALLRSAGFPGQLVGLTTSTGYQDIGPFRHQDPAGSGGTKGYIFSQ